MILFKSLSFLLIFLIFETVHSESSCKHDVTDCMTEGAQNVYNSLIAGVQDLIEPIDPMHVEKINADLPGLKYQLTNVTLNGLKNCVVELLKSDVITLDFESDLHCPQLVLTGHYDVKGVIFTSIDLDGQGFGTIVLDDYYIKIKGKFKEYISAKDQKPYISIVSHFIETDLKGKLRFESDELINPDKAKSDLAMIAINENYKDTEILIRSPILEIFMTLFVEKVNTYFANFSVDEIFPQE